MCATFPQSHLLHLVTGDKGLDVRVVPSKTIFDKSVVYVFKAGYSSLLLSQGSSAVSQKGALCFFCACVEEVHGDTKRSAAGGVEKYDMRSIPSLFIMLISMLLLYICGKI